MILCHHVWHAGTKKAYMYYLRLGVRGLRGNCGWLKGICGYRKRQPQTSLLVSEVTKALADVCGKRFPSHRFRQPESSVNYVLTMTRDVYGCRKPPAAIPQEGWPGRNWDRDLKVACQLAYRPVIHFHTYHLYAVEIRWKYNITC